MKKMIPEQKQILSRYEYHTRDSLVTLLDTHIKDLPAEQRNTVKFVIDEYGYAYDDNMYYALFMQSERLETDEEEQKRERLEDVGRTAIENFEREQYERLKKKFGD